MSEAVFGPEDGDEVDLAASSFALSKSDEGDPKKEKNNQSSQDVTEAKLGSLVVMLHRLQLLLETRQPGFVLFLFLNERIIRRIRIRIIAGEEGREPRGRGKPRWARVRAAQSQSHLSESYHAPVAFVNF